MEFLSLTIGPQGKLDCLYSKKNFFQKSKIRFLTSLWGGSLQNLPFLLLTISMNYKLSSSLIECAPDFIVRQVSGGICSTLLKSHRGSNTLNTMNYSSKAVQEPFLSKIFRRLELKISQHQFGFLLYICTPHNIMFTYNLHAMEYSFSTLYEKNQEIWLRVPFFSL